MKKICFDKISIELTRNCNMKCSHCFRGESENCDIKNEYIDSLFEQTEEIGELFFTGGEPTLAIDKMKYVLCALYKNAIPILQFGFVTNGLVFNDDIIEIIKLYSELVCLCRETIIGKELLPHYKNVVIGISMDNYHSNQKQVEENYNKYKKSLEGIAQVVKVNVGNTYRREGRAKNLPAGLKNLDLWQHTMKRVEILDKNHKPMCPHWREYKLGNSEQIIIVCDMYLSVKGNLITESLGMHEYSFVDNPKYNICNVKNENIYNSILLYNKGKYDCLSIMKIAADNRIKNPLKYFSDDLFSILAKDNSEPIVVNKLKGYVDLSIFERNTISNRDYPQRMKEEIANHSFIEKQNGGK